MENRKLKIIQTPARFYPSMGGVNKYVLDLSEQLVKLGHSVKVICANEPKSTLTNYKGIDIKRLPYLFKIANSNITLSLPFELLKSDFDLIHTHMPTPWSADLSILISRIKNKPIVITYHNDLIKSGLSGHVAWIYNHTLLRILLNNCDKIFVTHAEYINKSKYLGVYRNKLEIVPNGVLIEKKACNTARKNKNQIFFLSILDRYHRYKGLDILIKSVALIAKYNPHIRLIIGGEGELLDEYRELVSQLGIIRNVKFLGFVPNKNLKILFSKSSVFVLPSIDQNEGFGIVLLEALSFKTPVITTSITGISEDIRKNKCGIIVKPGDVSDLSNAISKVIGNPKMIQKMGLNGRLMVEKEYNWKKIAEKTLVIYKNILKYD